MEEFLANEIDELTELAADPTLESCCRRDLEDQLHVAKTKARLTPVDRTQIRQRMASRVVASAAHPRNEENDGVFDDDGLESESDELEALRALRLKELQTEAHSRTMLQSEGHGTVTTVAPTKLDKTIKESSAEYIICHFVIEGDEQGQGIDQKLESLACQFVATRFLRCPVPPRSHLCRRFGLSSAPGFVVFYGDAIIATCTVLDLECRDNEDVEDAAEQWLKRRKCLLVSSTDGGGGGAAAAVNEGVGVASGGGNDDDDEEGDADEWQKPCEECGRKYPHQHIRSMYASTEANDDD